MNGISIRTTTEADLDTIVALNHALFQEDAGQRDPSTNLDWSAQHGHEYFADLLQQDDVHCLIAEDEKEAVGYLLGHLRKPNDLRNVKLADLHSMFVQTDFRSAGVGSMLVKQFKEWCREHGVERISVSAFASNARAVAFYRKHGFEHRDVRLEAALDTARQRK